MFCLSSYADTWLVKGGQFADQKFVVYYNNTVNTFCFLQSVSPSCLQDVGNELWVGLQGDQEDLSGYICRFGQSSHYIDNFDSGLDTVLSLCLVGDNVWAGYRETIHVFDLSGNLVTTVPTQIPNALIFQLK